MLQRHPTLSPATALAEDAPILVTSQEAARICRVHASSIKRWCDAGELPCRLTAGGHRRIALDDLVAFGRQTGLATPLAAFGDQLNAVWRASSRAGEGHFDALVDLWFGWLMADEPGLLDPSMGLLLDRGLSLAAVLDQGLGRLMRRIGDAWEEGRIRIGDEHRASEHVMDALHALRGRLQPLPRPVDAVKRAVVGAAEGDPHHLGAFMVRLVLEQRGLTVNYLGANVPGEEFAAQQQRWGADLVCVSFTPPRGPDDAVRLVRSLAQGYDPARPYHLALGGVAIEGKVVDPPYRPFGSFAVMGSLVELVAWLDGRRVRADLMPGLAATDLSATGSSVAKDRHPTSWRSS